MRLATCDRCKSSPVMVNGEIEGRAIMELMRAAITVSGDKLDKETRSTFREPGFSTWAEVQLSLINGTDGRQWVRLMTDATHNVDCYHLGVTQARMMAAILSEMADVMDGQRKR